MVRLLFAAFAFLALALGLSSPALANASATGAIYLTTLPSGADAWVDGAYVGRSPVLIDALPVGKHTVTAAKTGWESRELGVSVTERVAFQFVDFQLQRAARAPRVSGRLALRASERIETLSVDGAAVNLSKPPILDLEPGPHTIEARVGNAKIVRHAVVYAETTTNVILRSTPEEDERTAVLAPAATYLPASDVVLDGRRIAIRHNGHTASGSIGDSTMRVDGAPASFAAAPALVEGKLYLPLELYVRLGAVPQRAR